MITSPAVEKTLSADTLVPGMHKYLFANLERRGNVPLWRCHQSKGSSERGTAGDLQYKSISSSALASAVLLCTAGSLVSLMKAGPSKLKSSDEALFLGAERRGLLSLTHCHPRTATLPWFLNFLFCQALDLLLFSVFSHTV